MSTEPVQCKYFFRTNGCSRGDACIYSHEKMDTDSFRQPTQIICIHHQRGFCRSGDLCKFFHAPAPEDSAAASRSWRSPRSVKPVSEFIPSAFSKPISSITPGAQKPLPFGSCKFFQQGQCTKGGSCTFSHSQPAAAAAFADPFRKTTHPVFISSAPNADAAPSPAQDNHLPSVGTTQRVMYNCSATFGAGASVIEVVTPFDSRSVALSNIPRDAKQEELIDMAEPFGALSSVTVSDTATSGLTYTSARITYSKCAEASRAVEALDGREFHGATLNARLDVRAIESGAGILLSRKVKVSWYAPTIMGWAHYSTISDAKSRAKELNGKTFQGCNISTSFQTPAPKQSESFSVVIKGLPLNSTKAQVARFCDSPSATVSRPSYIRDTGISSVRSLLTGLTFFEIRPAERKKISAFAEFSSADAAATAVSTLNGVRMTWLRGNPLWLEQIHSVKYNIPARQFAVLLPELEKFRDDDEFKCKIRYYERDENGVSQDPVCVRIYGPDAKAVGILKFGLEKLVQGKALMSGDEEFYDQYFETAEGEAFIQEVNTDLNVFVKLDTRTRTLRLFGAASLKDTVEDRITQRIADVHSKRHIIPLQRECLRSLLTGGLHDLHLSMGADKISLDVVARTITVKGTAEEVGAVRRAISAMLTSPDSRAEAGEECPVCFCETSDPVQLSCSHSYCSQCLRHLLRSAACADFSPSTLRCVADIDTEPGKATSCREHIAYSNVRDLLSPTEETKLLEASFLSHIHSHPTEFHYCPTPDCKNIYRQKQSGITLQCPTCLVRICPSCHIEFHEGLTCAEHRDNLGGGNDAFRKWKEEHNVKACPNCRADIEKNGGCNHMKCMRCRIHICWVCMATFTDQDSSGGVYEHLRRAHGGYT
ncbi:hypothetical protein FIBSPDRAFT_814883 [Athelia psychrophila]|uniref:Uncharacterized protein n=1 Tax=Athelia psychrophila TaxID=1759441 RepID=A0A166TFU8_9AGAM|nr:hypothetical protein FIBSPDRAFT_814883 [Fibularhizoctonia sp. CBS 109695]